MADKVKISDSTSTTSSVIAASCTAVKAAYDRAGTVMKGATSSAAGAAGIVPAPAASKQVSFLRGDGTWVVPTNTTYSAMTAATSSAAGKAGLVPAPAAGAQTKFLRGDATWQIVPVTSVNGKTGDVTIGEGTSSRKVFTSSGTFTTPRAGVYTFFLLSGGQGGRNAPGDFGGGNGGQAGKLLVLNLYIAANITCTITVGAGGAKASEGGVSSVKIGSQTYNTSIGTSINTDCGKGATMESSGTHTAGSACALGGGAGGAKCTGTYGGGGGAGGMVFHDISGTPTASNGTNANSSAENGLGGTGWGAGGGGGGNPRGSATGQGGAGAQGIVIIYY